MKKWIVGVGFLFILSGAIWLYSYGGLKQYIRAVSVVNQMTSGEKKLAWDEFSGTDSRGAERGILAGSWLGRVWVWTNKGLISYTVDQYSVYSLFEGCTDLIKEGLKRGERDLITRGIFTDFDVWKAKAKVGDYVAIYTTMPESGGTIGNLREIYTYNFWLFMNKGIDSECAK